MNKIIVISSDVFPTGGAQTNRIISYTRAFSESGYDTYIFSTCPYYSNNQINGQINNVKYKNNFVKRNKGKWYNKIYLRLIKINNIIKIYLEILKYKEIKFMVVQDNSIFCMFLFKIYSKIKKINILSEVNEYPLHIRRKNELSIFRKIDSFLSYKLLQYTVDGIFFMTAKLSNNFVRNSKRKIFNDIIPMSVEMDRFNCDSSKNKSDYIAYCGNMNNDKDGLENLIYSFQLFLKCKTNYSLLIIGNFNTDYGKKIKRIVKANNLENNVIFTGKIARNQIPIMLCSATILALARPNNKQAEGGFPTKLGEYLSTGIPCLVTRTGEIGNYLTNNYDIFFAEPDNVQDFCNKLIYIEENYQKALEVAKNGVITAKEHFDYKKNGDRIIALANKINKGRR